MSQVLTDEIKAQQKLDWQNHPYTIELIKELTNKRETLLKECENLSSNEPCPHEKIHNKLIEARLIRTQLDSYAKSRK
jgi:hypothetical protein